ncbi:MAG: ribosome biogenesis GTP-binding protein YihA/YsxC, partial [Thermovirgaceae bacterium]|nr:ribosome biogenesis GTP-binding protein YihA/YsxC [Thermovirgaceae bacterium]
MRPGKLKASLLATSFNEDQFPGAGYPEIAFAGRSNVGKSTFINGIIQTRLAHVSSTPGKTRSINFFKVEHARNFILVDLPGFGFAQRGKEERKAWAKLIESYISKRESLCLLVHLVDFRHGMLENDSLLQEWVQKHKVPVQVVYTKIDKISKGNWPSLSAQYSRNPFSSISEPLLVSMEKGLG